MFFTLIQLQLKFCSFWLRFFSDRYYRANSVRYPTDQCEGVCALNHYCAITRVDYHEFRSCLESAASALASSGNRPSLCIPIIANVALVLTAYTIMKCQQRKLLLEWFYFLVIDLIVNALLVKVITVVLNIVHKLRFQQQNCCVPLKLPSSKAAPWEHSDDGKCITTAAAVIHVAFESVKRMVHFIINAFEQLRMLMINVVRSKKACIVFTATVEQVNKYIAMANDWSQAAHHQYFLCKLCQSKLFKKLVSSNKNQLQLSSREKCKSLLSFQKTNYA